MGKKNSKTSLNEFLWSIQIQDEEQIRIGALLNNSESLAFKVFDEFSLKSKKFQSISKRYQKSIKGFTPGRPSYYPEAKKFILKAIVDNTARSDAWSAYRYALLKWISEELSAIDAILNQVFVDKDLEPNSENFITAFLDAASECDVEPADIKKLYEVWPFERIENFDSLLKDSKAFELPTLNKKSLKNINQKLSDFQTKIAMIEADLQNYKRQFGNLESLIENDFKTEATDVKIEIKNLKIEFIEKIKKQESNFEKKSQATKDLLTNIINEIKDCRQTCNKKSQDCSSNIENQIKEDREAQKKSIDGLTKRISNFEEGIAVTFDQVGEHIKNEISKVKNTIDLKIERLNRTLINSHKLLNDKVLENHFNAERDSDQDRNISENDFIFTFQKYLKYFNLSLNRQEALAWHIYLKEHSVLIINDRRIYDSWLFALGWNHLPIQYAASPKWSSPEDWQKNILNLLQSEYSSSPVIIDVFNFDFGLIEGYLMPIISLWSECRFKSGIGNKLILYPSSSVTPNDIALVCEHGKCLGVSSYDIDHDLNYGVSQFNISLLEKEIPITQETFNTWILPDKPIYDSFLNKFVTDCKHIFDQKDMLPPSFIFNGIPAILSRYAERFLKDEVLYSSFLNLYTDPWINIAETADK